MSQSWCSVADMKRGAAISTAFLALCGFAACAEIPDAREAWVCNALVEDKAATLLVGLDAKLQR